MCNIKWSIIIVNDTIKKIFLSKSYRPKVNFSTNYICKFHKFFSILKGHFATGRQDESPCKLKNSMNNGRISKGISTAGRPLVFNHGTISVLVYGRFLGILFILSFCHREFFSFSIVLERKYELTVLNLSSKIMSKHTYVSAFLFFLESASLIGLLLYSIWSRL
jgi:hypothetical protein